VRKLLPIFLLGAALFSLVSCGDPASTEGDAAVTKGMPEKQEAPPAAALRDKASSRMGGIQQPPLDK